MNKKGEKKRHRLPLEIRIQLYDEVHRLREQELGYRKIIRKIYEVYGIQLNHAHISFWVHGKHQPFGNVNKFNEKPSPELSYIIGAVIGDGCKNFNGRAHNLRLAVKDKEFAEAFGQCLAKILRKNKPYQPYWNKNREL